MVSFDYFADLISHFAIMDLPTLVPVGSVSGILLGPVVGGNIVTYGKKSPRSQTGAKFS